MTINTSNGKRKGLFARFREWLVKKVVIEEHKPGHCRYCGRSCFTTMCASCYYEFHESREELAAGQRDADEDGRWDAQEGDIDKGGDEEDGDES